jgi:hypothetical protein
LHTFKTYGILFLLFIVTIIVHFPILEAPFFRDDNGWAVASYAQNYIKHSFAIEDHFGYPYYRPISRIIFYAIHGIFENRPIYYHLFSLLLHFTCCILLFLYAKSLFKKDLEALLSAALFLFFPGYDYALYWVSNFPDILSGIIILGSLILNKKREQRYKNPIIWVLLTIAFFVKENTLVIPIMLACQDIFESRSIRAIIKKDRSKYSGILIISTFASILHLSIFIHVENGSSLSTGLMQSSKFFFDYMILSIFPFFIHTQNQSFLIVISKIVAGTLIFFPVIRSFIKKESRNGQLLVFYFLYLAPYIATSTFSTRYVYTASLFFAIILVNSISYYSDVVFRSKKTTIAIFTVLLLLIPYIYQVVQNQLYYRNLAKHELVPPYGVAIHKMKIWIENNKSEYLLFDFVQGERFFKDNILKINGDDNRFYDVISDFTQKRHGLYIHRKGSYDVLWLESDTLISFSSPLNWNSRILDVNLDITIINLLTGKLFDRILRVNLDENKTDELKISNSMHEFKIKLQGNQNEEHILRLEVNSMK